MIENPKFIINDEMLNKCKQFAKDSVGTSTDKYANRNQFNIYKIIDDITNGKLAEEAVWQKVSQIYPNLSKPDYNIYDKKQKSWDPDLKDPSILLSVAVKSQEIKSEIAYGRSWVFQYREGSRYDCDKGIFGQIDNNENRYVSFVTLNIPRRCGEIHAIVKVQWLHDNKLFKPMKKQSLQNNKIAVYFDDLEKTQDNLWQI